MKLVEFANFLTQGRHVYRFATLNPAGCRLERALKQSQQSGLSGAIHANHSDSIAWSKSPGDILQNLVALDDVAQVFDVEHVFAEALGSQF